MSLFAQWMHCEEGQSQLLAQHNFQGDLEPLTQKE